MKILTRICCIFIVSFSLIGLVGCTNTPEDVVYNSAEDVIGKDVIYNNAEDVIRKYMNTYYTISKDDIDLYKKIKADKTKDDLNKDIKAISIRFEPLLSGTYYEGLVGTKESYERIKEASRYNYTTSVRNVKLQKFSESINKDMETYDCTIEIAQSSLTSSRVVNIEAHQGLMAMKSNSGWIVLKPIKSGAEDENNKVETLIKYYINAYCTIDKDDIALYKKIIAGNKDVKTHESDIYKSSDDIRGALTPKAYRKLIDSKMDYGRYKLASEGNFYITIKNIKLSKTSEDKVARTKIYTYDINLIQTSIADNKAKEYTDTKQIILVENNVNGNDTWRIDYAGSIK